MLNRRYFLAFGVTRMVISIQLGIALAANIGGQSSPISSPQNLIALEYMHPPLDWLQWFAVALPVSFISLILIWLLLLLSYRPGMTADGEELEIKPIRPKKEPWTLKQWWVTLVCVITITLWCIEHKIEPWVGDMGVIALIPIVLFFSTGVLNKASVRICSCLLAPHSYLCFRTTSSNSCGVLFVSSSPSFLHCSMLKQ